MGERPELTADQIYELPVHPVAEQFPMLDPDSFEALLRDIESNGLRQPLAMWQGQLLKGRNRRQCCMELGLDVVQHAHLNDDDDPHQFVISANLHRRHLTVSQRVGHVERKS